MKVEANFDLLSYFLVLKSLLRLKVRTLPFRGDNTGSRPVEDNKNSYEFEIYFIFLA